MTMDARKQRVLQAIVALYGLEGEPVGSSVLANYFDMAVSSATLRNEMAALTKLGLLEQPHTSAGRVPSAKGYRYYLDNLLTDDQPLDRVTRARVEAVFASLDHEPESSHRRCKGAGRHQRLHRSRPAPPVPKTSASPTTKSFRWAAARRLCWPSRRRAMSAPVWRGSAPASPARTPLRWPRCSTAT